jgi:outer membrane murein-binding lipoprotein Lpp
MKRLWVMLAAALVLAGCEGDKLEATRKRVEAAERELRELEAKTQALSGDVDRLRKRLGEVEATREADERRLELLQDTLAKSWRGDPGTLRRRMEAAEVPSELQASLLKAQERKGSIVAERLFIEGVEKADLEKVASALENWELRTGVTTLPTEPPPVEPESTCEQQEVTVSCLPLQLEGPKDLVTQLCRMSEADSVWVLRSEQGSLSRVNLVGSRHDRYRPVRMLSPEVWVVAGEDDSPTSPGTSKVSAKEWLEVFKLTGASEYTRQALRAHALPLEKLGQRATLAELDLDTDGAPEILVLDGKDVRALHYDARHDEADLWTEPEVCPLIARRTEKELEPARAPCTAWEQARQPRDGGAP